MPRTTLRDALARLLLAMAMMLSGSPSANGQEVPAWVNTLPRAFRSPTLQLELWQWMGLVVVALGSFLAGFVAFRLLAVLFRLSRHTKGIVASIESGKGVKRASSFLVTTFVFANGIGLLALPAHAVRKAELAILVAQTLAAALIVAALWDAACERLADRAEERALRARALLIPFAQKFGRFFVFCTALVVAFGSLGYNVSAIIAGLGIGGVAIALAAKDSIENLFGTLTIVLDLPFKIGDWVKIGTVDGTVEEINLRSTRIRTAEDSLITLPNSNLIKASVENLGLRRFRRFKTTLLVRNQLTPDQLRQFCDALRALLADQPANRAGEESVHVLEIGVDNVAIQIMGQLDVSDYASELSARHEILLGALALAARQNVNVGPMSAPAASAPPELPECQAHS